MPKLYGNGGPETTITLKQWAAGTDPTEDGLNPDFLAWRERRFNGSLKPELRPRHPSYRPGRALPLATCACPRRIRVARSVLAAGPITCGCCGADFAARNGHDRVAAIVLTAERQMS